MLLREFGLFNRTRHVLAAAALICALAPRVAQADDLQDAVRAVQHATDDEIRTELQRRHEERHDVPKTLQRNGASRSLKIGLGIYDDATLAQAVRAARASGRVIYGVDDREDWYQIKDDGIKRLASASVALFSAASLEPSASGEMTLKAKTLAESWGLCRNETFAEQATGAFCSGTLVGDDVVLTAGHCAREISNNPNVPYVNAVNFVFGYRVDTPGSPGTLSIPANQVFQGKQVLAGELAGERGRDWSLIELDRPVPASVAKPVSAWRTTPVMPDESVFVIGYPSGLPLKYAPGAGIRQINDPVYFVANLDTFGGNSGSGVYDAATQELVGILVRGDTDYVKDEAQNCLRVNICPTSGCRGEDVTRISLVPKP